METLNKENLDQAIIAPSYEQIVAEVQEAVDVLSEGLAVGHDVATGHEITVDRMPIWYVLTKAAGATGIPLATLYNDPVARQHAIAVMLTDMAAAQRAQKFIESWRERKEKEAASVAERLRGE